MAIKFRVQFAGADFNLPRSSRGKWLRTGLLAALLTFAALAYWQYLRYLSRPHLPVAAHAVPAVPNPSTAHPTAPVAPPVAPPDVKKVADDSIVAVGNNPVQVKPSQLVEAAPAATAVPSKPVATAVAAPTVAPARAPVVQRPVQRPYRVRTEQDRLLMAGQTAFANVIDLANKYPDAYGFQAGDFISDAKLGTPMPVYTIDESARANYRAGEPVRPLLKPAPDWVFPVLMGHRICCMVSVHRTGDDFVPGSGSKSLAMAWKKILEKWPADKGYHPLLVMNPDIPGYYFTVPELPVQNITDTVQMFLMHPSPSPADVILASWR
jgi:hypothetical protein